MKPSSRSVDWIQVRKRQLRQQKLDAVAIDLARTLADYLREWKGVENGFVGTRSTPTHLGVSVLIEGNKQFTFDMAYAFARNGERARMYAEMMIDGWCEHLGV